MVLKRFSLLTPLALAGLSLWGCGNGSSSSTGTSGTSLTRANTQLNQITSGQQTTNDTTLNSTLSLFSSALQQDPTNQGALFGQAVCQAGITAGTLTDQSTATVGTVANGTAIADASGTAVSTGQALPPAPPDGASSAQPVPPSSQLGLLWHLEDGVSNPYTLLTTLAPIANLRYGLIPFNGYFADDVTARQQDLATLDTVAQNLQTLESNPNFVTTLTLPSKQGGVVKVGLPEVYLFEAYVQTLRAQLALSLAYVRDIGINDNLPGPFLPYPYTGSGAAVAAHGNTGSGAATVAPGNAATVGISSSGGLPGYDVLSLDKNGDGKLTPDEYLPASPYLTLRDATLLQKAQGALQAIADRETKGIQGVFARPSDGSGSFLIPNSATIHAVLDNALTNVVPLIQQASVGPVTLSVPHYQPPINLIQTYTAGPISSKATRAKTRRVFLLGGTSGNIVGAPIGPGPIMQPTFVSVTFNLAAWFANPPADLKAFAPTYTLDSNKVPDLSKTTYPDTTFGGLFPKGLPAALML